LTGSGEEPTLAALRRAWKRASEEEREQFLAEIVKQLEERPSARGKAPRQRRRALAQYLYPSPPRRK
jgi:hypothetical protein